MVATWHSYGREYSTPPTVHYFVFVFESIDLMKVGDHLASHIDEHRLDVAERIDCVCVLDRGVISNKVGDGQFDALPEEGSKLDATRTKRALLLFYTLIARYIFQFEMPSFRFGDYTTGMVFGPEED